MIGEKIGVSKSTLSNWLGKIPFKPNKEVVKKVGMAKLKSALYKHRLKFENIAKMKMEADIDIGKLSKRDIFMLGIGVYLGEGSKSQEEIRVVNSDPAILKLAVKWLREFGKIDINHIRVAIHGYPDHNINELLSFWSETLNIPPQQFIKTNIDIRKNKLESKKRKLPYGTAHLYVRGGGTLPSGVKGLHRKIMGWIESSVKQI
ncbi:MAG TPA: hypothetical protein VMV71_03965 [Candidatus Paceibacterota bacterium]|nr:hypothetical protein [Candidatus Paceibacterota bacterium]